MTKTPSNARKPKRLSPKVLAKVPQAVQRYGYDRSLLTSGIVHLGLGAFFRAHGAEYVEDVLERDFGPWGIIGASLQRPDQRDRLTPQEGLYTLLKRDAKATRARIIGAVQKVLVAPESPEALLQQMDAKAIRIVSLTVTEKGYCHVPATGRIDETHADIRHDLENRKTPKTAVGIIAASLRRRRDSGSAPFTVLCCDNLPANGNLVAGLLHDFAAMQDDKFANWVERNVAFPATMVDRIVPAATDADRAEALQLTGFEDAAAIAHEPFRQWVVEDKFVDDARPRFELADVQMVGNVAPFEHAKLGMLNATHSAMAYLGCLSGFETIAEAVSNPAIRAFVHRLWHDEIIPALPAPPGLDLERYAGALLARYDNEAIRHRTWQIAMDGSQKLPQRILGTIRKRLDVGLASPGLALAVAGWMRYVRGFDEKGRVIDIRDPLLPLIRERLSEAGNDRDEAAALLGIHAVFGSDLPSHDGFRKLVINAYEALARRGALATIGSYNQGQ